MKKKRLSPYIFLLLLIFILVFAGGVQYGKKVEKANKTIDYLLSITPTKSPTPFIAPTITYSRFEHEGCALSFLKPSYVDIKKESSISASFVSEEKTMGKISCQNNKKGTSQIDQKNATDSASITIANMKAFKKEVTDKKTKQKQVEYTIVDTKNNKTITILVDQQLAPVLEQTLEINNE